MCYRVSRICGGVQRGRRQVRQRLAVHAGAGGRSGHCTQRSLRSGRVVRQSNLHQMTVFLISVYKLANAWDQLPP
jgi:hypothetical protein